jgi:hypothetical protein
MKDKAAPVSMSGLEPGTSRCDKYSPQTFGATEAREVHTQQTDRANDVNEELHNSTCIDGSFT